MTHETKEKKMEIKEETRPDGKIILTANGKSVVTTEAAKEHALFALGQAVKDR